MYAYISGQIDTLEATHAIIDANGVGYFLKISLNTYSQLTRAKSAKAKLFTYLQIQDNAHNLFGFADLLEKALFLELITISGIGPSTAIVMLSSMSPEEIQTAIANEDARSIQRIKGIGAKTAQRVVLELKDKLGKNALLSSPQSSITPKVSIKQEALLALTTLGFPKNTAQKNIEKVLKNSEGDISLEELIKEALKL